MVNESKNKPKLSPLVPLIMGFLLMMGVSVNAYSATNWKEEVLLHDGGKIIVERSQSRGGKHEIGQSRPVKKHDITFALPDSTQTVTWKDEYSKDVGHSNFDLLALHILDGAPYLVASPFGCLSYNKCGRPNPPYVILKYDGKAWNRISLVEFPAELQTLNLVQDTDNNEKRLSFLGLVSAEQVKGFNRNYRQPEFKTILREAVKGGEGLTTCPIPSTSAAKLIAPEIDGKTVYYNWWPLATDWLKSKYGGNKWN